MKRSPIELGVLKAFEFVSQLRRASVIVRNFGSPGCDIYVKGAPEMMGHICRPESCKYPLSEPLPCFKIAIANAFKVPSDYEDLLAYYTQRGFRVIACATKHIAKLNWVKVQKMKREEAESELDFVGFIIFENKLKPSTAGVLDELTEAGIRKVMCTGDNILTAISVARECNLIDKTAHCFVPHFTEGKLSLTTSIYSTTDQSTGGRGDPKSRILWESIDNSIYTLDDKTLIVS